MIELLDEMVVESGPCAETDAAIAAEAVRNAEIARKAVAFAAENTGWSHKAIARRFGLDARLAKDYGNGLCRLDLMAGNAIAITVTAQVADWFRV